MRNGNRIQIKYRDGKSSLRSPKRRSEDKGELFLQEIGYDVLDYMHLTVM